MSSNLELSIDPSDIRRDAGSSWLVRLPDIVSPGDSSEQAASSKLLLMEDGVALGPAHALHEDIRKVGAGAYSHWGRTLYFSTPDASDPRVNGRRYAVTAPLAEFSPASMQARIDKAFNDLHQEFHNYSKLSHEQVSEAIGLAKETILRTISFGPEMERSTEQLRLCTRLEALKGAVFESVNGFMRTSPTFDDHVESVVSRYRDGRAVHLELGTYIAWPDDRVDAHRSASGLGDFVRLDMNTSFPLDIAASVTSLPFADESIDVISSNSLFEHVAYPHEIIREAYRVLRPGGALVTTVPFHFVAHGCPADYLRYTGQFFEEVCGAAGFDPTFSDTWGTSGVYYTTHQFLKGVTAKDAAHTRMGVAAQMSHLTMMTLLAGMQTFDDHMDGGGANHFHATRAIAVKPGDYVARPHVPDLSLPFVERYADILICPVTGLPVRREGTRLVSLDGTRSYDIVDGRPDMFVIQGFGSSFTTRASSRDRLAEWQRTPRA